MPITGKSYPGAYREGDSYLHQLDPRFKLLLLCLLMACLFSATAGWRLSLLLLVWGGVAHNCGNGWRDALKVFRLLRWLLLCTLLLHLFFTPGRTLLGTSWLSYDGLLRGLLIDSQLLLAVLFSMLLAWTTKPERLAWGLTKLLSPLQKFRLPVKEAGGLLVLVMQFLPLIRQEVAGLQRDEERSAKGLVGIKVKAAMIVPLLMRLVDRADRLAMDIAAGNTGSQQFESDRRLTQFDWVFFATACVLLTLLWMV